MSVLITVLCCLLPPMATSFTFGYLVGHDRGEAKANRYHVDQKIRDYERARDLFDNKWTTQPNGSRTGPAVNDAAVELLKANPEEFFRLSKLWGSR